MDTIPVGAVTHGMYEHRSRRDGVVGPPTIDELESSPNPGIFLQQRVTLDYSTVC